MALITGYGETFKSSAYAAEVIRFGTSKTITPSWRAIFLRAIGANWLVCVACFLSMMPREYFSKVMAIWWPTFAFVSLGFDHVVSGSGPFSPFWVIRIAVLRACYHDGMMTLTYGKPSRWQTCTSSRQQSSTTTQRSQSHTTSGNRCFQPFSETSSVVRCSSVCSFGTW